MACSVKNIGRTGLVNFREIFAGALRMEAQRLRELSQSNSEPNGSQARAQAAKAESLVEQSYAEMSACASDRDFDSEKVSREEVDWAIRFAEEETERLMALFIELHEQEHGPIGDLAEALERKPGQFEMNEGQEKTIEHWSEYQVALLELIQVRPIL